MLGWTGGGHCDEERAVILPGSFLSAVVVHMHGGAVFQVDKFGQPQCACVRHHFAWMHRVCFAAKAGAPVVVKMQSPHIMPFAYRQC